MCPSASDVGKLARKDVNIRIALLGSQVYRVLSLDSPQTSQVIETHMLTVAPCVQTEAWTFTWAIPLR